MERVSALMGSRVFASVIPVTLALLGVADRESAGFVPRRHRAGAAARSDADLFLGPGASRSDAAVLGVRHRACSKTSSPAARPACGRVSFVVTYALIDRQRDAFAGLSGVGAILGFATAATLCLRDRLYGGGALSIGASRRFAPVMGELAMSVIFYRARGDVPGL